MKKAPGFADPGLDVRGAGHRRIARSPHGLVGARAAGARTGRFDGTVLTLEARVLPRWPGPRRRALEFLDGVAPHALGFGEAAHEELVLFEILVEEAEQALGGRELGAEIVDLLQVQLGAMSRRPSRRVSWAKAIDRYW
jgi:hypothetical protein